ncbi:MAG: hypothetical protein ACPGWR_32310, partial [Ardenticatenaceae bacterium]
VRRVINLGVVVHRDLMWRPLHRVRCPNVHEILTSNRLVKPRLQANGSAYRGGSRRVKRIRQGTMATNEGTQLTPYIGNKSR